MTRRSKGSGQRNKLAATRVLRLARSLLSLPTAPYHEHAIGAAVETEARRLGLAVRRDEAGNLWLRGSAVTSTRSPLVLMAHMDHPGFEVVGRRRLEFLGYVPRGLFRDARVRVAGVAEPVRIRRVVRSLPHGWLLETVEDSLPVGAMGLWDLPSIEMKGGRLLAPGIDDVLGVAVVLAVMEELQEQRAGAAVWGLLTRAEEVGFHGAVEAARSGRLPRTAVVISIEMSREQPWARSGEGPVVRVGDRLTVFDRDVVWYLGEVARAEAIKMQRALMDGGTCEASALAAFGYPVGGVCVPLRGYHNIGCGERPVRESVAVRDVVELVRLLAAAARRWKDRHRWMKGWRERVARAAQTAPRRLSR